LVWTINIKIFRPLKNRTGILQVPLAKSLFPNTLTTQRYGAVPMDFIALAPGDQVFGFGKVKVAFSAQLAEMIGV
jgi:hypothetical protein